MWNGYWRTKSEVHFNALFNRYEYLIKLVFLTKFKSKLGSHEDDFMADGKIGLWYAIRDWKPVGGGFEPFAYMCIYRQMCSHTYRKFKAKGRQPFLMTTEKIMMLAKRGGYQTKHDDVSKEYGIDLFMLQPDERSGQEIKNLIEHEHAQKELKHLFKGREHYYDLLLDWYGERKNTEEMMEEHSGRFKNPHSLKNRMHQIKQDILGSKL